MNTLTKEEAKEYETWLDEIQECPICLGEGFVESQPMYADDPNAGKKILCKCKE